MAAKTFKQSLKERISKLHYRDKGIVELVIKRNCLIDSAISRLVEAFEIANKEEGIYDKISRMS